MSKQDKLDNAMDLIELLRAENEVLKRRVSELEKDKTVYPPWWTDAHEKRLQKALKPFQTKTTAATLQKPVP